MLITSDDIDMLIKMIREGKQSYRNVIFYDHIQTKQQLIHMKHLVCSILRVYLILHKELHLKSGICY